MHTRFLPYLLALLLTLSGAASLAQAQENIPITFQSFYDGLSTQGTWIQTPDYGYVFQPAISDPAWGPYTDGHWIYSEAGWTWISDEPWGWATYHYGRWANLDGCGWVWVPGYRWAPAWVSWRYGAGYVGWAPLPPDTIAGADYVEPGGNPRARFHVGGDADISFGIGAGCYNFIPLPDLGEPNCRPFIVNRHTNYFLINRTTNITNITITRQPQPGANRFREVTVFGPPLNEVNAVSIHHVPTVRLMEAPQPGNSLVRGKTLNVYAPPVDLSPNPQARPARVDQILDQRALNRGLSIEHPLMVNSRLQPFTPTTQEIRQAETAQAKAPKHALVALHQAPLKPLALPVVTGQKPVHPSGPEVAPVLEPTAFHPTASQPSGPVNKPHPDAKADGTSHPPTQKSGEGQASH